MELDTVELGTVVVPEFVMVNTVAPPGSVEMDTSEVLRHMTVNAAVWLGSRDLHTDAVPEYVLVDTVALLHSAVLDTEVMLELVAVSAAWMPTRYSSTSRWAPWHGSTPKG